MVFVGGGVAILTPMGVDKAGTQAVPASTTTKLTGWATRSGYPETVIDNNDLVVNGPGNITPTLKITLTSNAPAAIPFRILKGGAQIASGNIPFNTTTAQITAPSTPVVPGDRISADISPGLGASVTIQSGPANTFMFWD